MNQRNALSGGVFLTLFIIAGAVAGIARGQAMLGVLAGTAIGILFVILVWLLDRRRG